MGSGSKNIHFSWGLIRSPAKESTQEPTHHRSAGEFHGVFKLSRQKLPSSQGAVNVPALTPGFDAVWSVFSQIITFVQHIKGAETWVFTISPSAVL